jgi:prevent-host-death family protein
MKFVNVRDFRNSSRDIWERVSNDEDVIITNNGKPTAILVSVSECNLDEVLASIRQARAMRAFNRLQEQASSSKHMDDSEIDAVIKAYRAEKHSGQ